MKKHILCFVCFAFCSFFTSQAHAQVYYKIPEPIYLETIQYIESSIQINQKLNMKVTELKQQQKILQKQIEILKQQQQTLNNSYSNNNNILMEQNKILQQQSESLKKKLNRSKVEKTIILGVLGYVIIKNI